MAMLTLASVVGATRPRRSEPAVEGDADTNTVCIAVNARKMETGASVAGQMIWFLGSSVKR